MMAIIQDSFLFESKNLLYFYEQIIYVKYDASRILYILHALFIEFVCTLQYL